MARLSKYFDHSLKNNELLKPFCFQGEGLYIIENLTVTLSICI